MWECKCLLKYAAFLNALLHFVHRRGLSPVWVLRFPAQFLHNCQPYCFPSLWVSICPLKLFACDDVLPHWLLLFWLFSTVCLQMLFQIARLRGYIFTLITFCLNILHCVFSSSNDLRINYHIGCICLTFLTWENFCTTSTLSPEMRPLPSVSFNVHLQVVSTRKCFST